MTNWASVDEALGEEDRVPNVVERRIGQSADSQRFPKLLNRPSRLSDKERRYSLLFGNLPIEHVPVMRP
jgi:hypothetical protein